MEIAWDCHCETEIAYRNKAHNLIATINYDPRRSFFFLWVFVFCPRRRRAYRTPCLFGVRHFFCVLWFARYNANALLEALLSCCDFLSARLRPHNFYYFVFDGAIRLGEERGAFPFHQMAMTASTGSSSATFLWMKTTTIVAVTMKLLHKSFTLYSPPALVAPNFPKPLLQPQKIFVKPHHGGGGGDKAAAQQLVVYLKKCIINPQLV